MKFTKMHGIGNDYVYVNGFTEKVDDPAALAPRISDRHTGVGGDGLILVLPPEEGVAADVRMRMFNADGSESEMCGNGVRCVAKYAHDHGLATANPMRVQTGNGVLNIVHSADGAGKLALATVDMGEPILKAAKVPVAVPGVAQDQRVVDVEMDWPAGCEALAAAVKGGVTCVSMGNPHAMFYVDDVAAVELERVGPLLEKHPWFVNRMNVHFVQVHSEAEATMRTWERGSGITLACGTGASAVCVAGVLTGRSGRKLLAHLPGGDLELEWRESDGRVYMTGPATEVFTGEWPA
ncbi:MAG: diaminopimelate epimerase [Phycisphaeraceae bacterium]